MFLNQSLHYRKYSIYLNLNSYVPHCITESRQLSKDTTVGLSSATLAAVVVLPWWGDPNFPLIKLYKFKGLIKC